jgi:hypothetical protein
MQNWRWPSFTPEEILSTTQLKLLDEKGVFPYSFRSLDKLEEFRSFVGHPLIINAFGRKKAGARSVREVVDINREIRGADRAWEYSFHLWCAFDVKCPSISARDLYIKAISFGKWGGVGRYDTFVHVDDRDNLSGITTTWDLRSGKYV